MTRRAFRRVSSRSSVFDDAKTTGADELAYAALVFRTLFWLAATIGCSTWFVLWITPYAFPGA